MVQNKGWCGLQTRGVGGWTGRRRIRIKRREAEAKWKDFAIKR